PARADVAAWGCPFPRPRPPRPPTLLPSTTLFRSSFPYWAGAATVLYPGKPTPRAVFETIQRCRPTLFFGVPTLYNAMLNDPEARSEEHTSEPSHVKISYAVFCLRKKTHAEGSSPR